MRHKNVEGQNLRRIKDTKDHNIKKMKLSQSILYLNRWIMATQDPMLTYVFLLYSTFFTIVSIRDPRPTTYSAPALI